MLMSGIGDSRFIFCVVLATLVYVVTSHGVQPLSRIAIHETTIAVDEDAYVKVSPTVLGLNVNLISYFLFRLIYHHISFFVFMDYSVIYLFRGETVSGLQ